MESRVSTSLSRSTRETWSVCERASVRTMKSKSAAVNRARQFARTIGALSWVDAAPIASRIDKLLPHSIIRNETDYTLRASRSRTRARYRLRVVQAHDSCFRFAQHRRHCGALRNGVTDGMDPRFQRSYFSRLNSCTDFDNFSNAFQKRR